MEISTKQEAINYIIHMIYEKPHTLPITQIEMSALEEYCKENLTKAFSYEDFLMGNVTYTLEKQKYTIAVTTLIGKLESGKREIKKQFQANKGLQGAVLSECIYAQTLAHALSLNKLIDLDTTPFNEIPLCCKDVLKYIQASQKSISAARYIYYSNNSNDYIIQYGNPESGDASIIYTNNVIKVEFKQQEARAGEYDLLVDIDGHLSLSDKTKLMFGDLIDNMIDEFNQSYSLFEHLGSNYKIPENSENIKRLYAIAKKYFEIHEIDLIITSIDDILLAIKPEDIDIAICEDEFIYSVKGSEIRTTGKNPKLVKSIDLLDLIINKDPSIHVLNEDGDCKISPTIEYIKGKTEGSGYVKGRSKNTIDGYKIYYIFNIHKKDFEKEDRKNKELYFNKSRIKEKSPTFSVHLILKADYEVLKRIYDQN